MKTIDFLPQKYHQQQARHRAGLWRLAVVALLGGVVAATSIAQFVQRNRVRRQLDELQPLYADAQAKQSMLAQMQTELTRETAAATLYAYLQTPWPRTQLVAAVAMPVSDGLRIEQLHVVDTGPAASAAPPSETATAAPARKHVARDARLDDHSDRRRDRVTQAEITGTCPHAAAAHEYLGQLEKSPLVARAQLVSLENVSIEGKTRELRFTAQVTLHPARGWSSSPPAEPSAAGTTLTQTTRPTP